MKLTLNVFFSFYSFLIFGQCNCETKIILENKIGQCVPSLVAYDNTYQIGASINFTNSDVTLILTIRFNGNAETIGSDLLVFVNGEKTLNLKLMDSQKDYVGGSQICHTKFKLTESDVEFLKTKNLSSFRFHFLKEDIYRTFRIKKNHEILKTQLNCII